jgi:hypothetical protein
VKLKHPLLPTKHEAASDALERAIGAHEADRITLGELTHALHERGFGLLMMILVLPNCVPIPTPPGYSTVFAIPLIYLSLQMILGFDAPRLPDWLATRGISRSFLARMISVINPRLKQVEILLRPRLSFVSTRVGERVIGVFWLLFAISIALPLPGMHFVPGIGILVSSLGLLNKDGITMLLGLVIGCAGLTLSAMVVILGAKAAKTTLALLGL